MSKEVEVDQTSTSASKPGTNKQTENLDPTPLRPPLRIQCMILTRDTSQINIQVSPRNPLGLSRLDPQKHADKRKHKIRSRYLSQSSSSEEDQSSVHIQRSSKPSRVLSDQDQPQYDPDHFLIGK